MQKKIGNMAENILCSSSLCRFPLSIEAFRAVFQAMPCFSLALQGDALLCLLCFCLPCFTETETSYRLSKFGNAHLRSFDVVEHIVEATFVYLLKNSTILISHINIA